MAGSDVGCQVMGRAEYASFCGWPCVALVGQLGSRGCESALSNGQGAAKAGPAAAVAGPQVDVNVVLRLPGLATEVLGLLPALGGFVTRVDRTDGLTGPADARSGHRPVPW